MITDQLHVARSVEVSNLTSLSDMVTYVHVHDVCEVHTVDNKFLF